MAIRVKMIQRVEVKANGDVFHELIGKRPQDVSNIASAKVQGCELHEGEFGTVDSIISWSYYHDGKARVAKQHVEDIDEVNKVIRLRMLDGDIMEHYKTFITTLQVENKGENDLVTWTFDYEKLNADVEEPTDTMDFLVALIKDIEAHHLK